MLTALFIILMFAVFGKLILFAFKASWGILKVLLTIIILLVLLVFAINGYMRGFARTLTSLLFFVFSGVPVSYTHLTLPTT